MKVINRSTGEILLEELKIADTFRKRFFGLMGKRSLDPKTGLKIEPCNSIHTFFMKFPIDVLFLSKENEVLQIIPEMRPGKISPMVKNARYVIESNQNVFMNKVKVGDYIVLDR